MSSGGLIDVFACERLEHDAARDEQARAEQERLRIGYLAADVSSEAKRRKHDVPLQRRGSRRAAPRCYALIDGEQLRICRDLR